jgi:hypothetical protein
MKTFRSALLTLFALPLVALAQAPASEQKSAAKPPEAATKAEKPQESCPHSSVPTDAKPVSGWTLTRGEPLKGAPSVTLAELLAKPQAQEGKMVRVEGLVRKACEKKGCWMELAEGAKGAGVRVTFKDYGFFVPLDSAGSSARVEGVVKVTELSDAMAKHYEAEGAMVPRGGDGKPREVQLVATGVELRH